MPFSLEGIITALITPFDKSGEIKEGSLRELIRFQLQKGVNGFFTCGSTGQGALMNIDERKSIAEAVMDEAGHRVPVIIQVGAADTQTAVELAKHAEKIGADAIACVTPYYYQPDEEGLIRHYEDVARAVSLPLFAYNIPRHTGVNIKADTVSRLAKMNAIVGVKESSRDFLQLIEIIDTLPREFIVIDGTEGYLFPALVMGAKGAVSALANALPELFTGLYAAFNQGDLMTAKSIQFKLNRVKRITDRPSLAPIFEILRERGMDCGNPRKPLRPLTEGERLQMLDGLRKLDVL